MSDHPSPYQSYQNNTESAIKRIIRRNHNSTKRIRLEMKMKRAIRSSDSNIVRNKYLLKNFILSFKFKIVQQKLLYDTITIQII